MHVRTPKQCLAVFEDSPNTMQSDNRRNFRCCERYISDFIILIDYRRNSRQLGSDTIFNPSVFVAALKDSWNVEDTAGIYGSYSPDHLNTDKPHFGGSLVMIPMTKFDLLTPI